MKTLQEVLEALEARVDRHTLDKFIARKWVRPHRKQADWHFEDIDIARLELICYLTQDIEINDDGMDVVLSLLDQLYGLRTHMQKFMHAISQQPPQVQNEILMIIKRSTDAGETS